MLPCMALERNASSPPTFVFYDSFADTGVSNSIFPCGAHLVKTMLLVNTHGQLMSFFFW